MKNSIYRQKLAEFNQDCSILKVRDLYNRPSFFELMSKDRSEAVHSSFLSWLLSGHDMATAQSDTPFMRFLDVIWKRYNQQSTNIENADRFDRVFNSVLSRTIKVEDLELKTEVPVKELADIYDIPNVPSNNDRIDLLINAQVSGIGIVNKIQIIVENKIGSLEGTPKPGQNSDYDSMYQTERYYAGTFANVKMHPGLCQIYVYLSPLFSSHLNDFKNLLIDERPRSSHYIQINYQDICDMIINPLLDLNSLSERTKVFLKEYKQTLLLPSYVIDESNQVRADKTVLMALPSQDVELLQSIWVKYSDLIKTAIVLGVANVSFDKISRQTYFDEMIREYGFSYDQDLFSSGKKKAVKTFAKKDQAYFEELCKNSNDEGHTLMLLGFFARNRKLITAILTILDNSGMLSGEVADDVSEALSALTSSVDTSRYYVCVNGKKTTDRPLSKRGVVKEIVCTLIPQPGVGSVMTDLNNKLSRTFIVTTCPADITRFWGVDKIDGVWQTFDLTDSNKESFPYYVSNQWGCSPNPNKPGSWELLLDLFMKPGYCGVSVTDK